MSTRPTAYNPKRVCLLSLPDLSEFPKLREWGIYFAGMLSSFKFASGWWFFFDAAIISKRTKSDDPFEDVPVRISFVDYIPAILSTFGMIIVSLINKSQISRENDDPYAWKARCWLFVGFALLAGGLAGSVSLLVIKYIVPEYPSHYVSYGIAVVIQNIAIMLSTILTWIVGQSDTEYECEWYVFLSKIYLKYFNRSTYRIIKHCKQFSFKFDDIIQLPF
ncbi:UPF0220-domain-containing protein [Wallemia mellicola]|nr:UPF0220-domain-containing protein [Wallemia mellicola]